MTEALRASAIHYGQLLRALRFGVLDEPAFHVQLKLVAPEEDRFQLALRHAQQIKAERRDFWEICEDRYQVRSTILTSQLPVSRWHEQVGDPTLADGILDRLVHNAHRIEKRGDSMRKNRGKTSG